MPLFLNIFVNYFKFFSLYIISMCRCLNIALFLKIFICQFYYCNFTSSGTYSTINFDLYFVWSLFDSSHLRCYAKVLATLMFTIGTVSINKICFCNFFVIFIKIFLFPKKNTKIFFLVSFGSNLFYDVFHLYVWDSIFYKWLWCLNES